MMKKTHKRCLALLLPLCKVTLLGADLVWFKVGMRGRHAPANPRACGSSSPGDKGLSVTKEKENRETDAPTQY